MAVQGNLAYELNYEENFDVNSVTEVAKKRVVKTKAKKKTKTRDFAMFTLVAMTFLLGVGVLISNAIIYETNYSINQLNEEYKSLAKINSELEVQLMKGNNLEALETVAVSQLGMQFPEQYQYEYVSVVQVAQVAAMPKDYHGSDNTSFVEKGDSSDKDQNLLEMAMSVFTK